MTPVHHPRRARDGPWEDAATPDRRALCPPNTSSPQSKRKTAKAPARRERVSPPLSSPRLVPAPCGPAQREPGARRPVGWRRNAGSARFMPAKYILPLIEAQDRQSARPPGEGQSPAILPAPCSRPMRARTTRAGRAAARGMAPQPLNSALYPSQIHPPPKSKREIAKAPARHARGVPINRRRTFGATERSLGHCTAMPCRQAIARNRREAVARPAPAALFGRGAFRLKSMLAMRAESVQRQSSYDIHFRR